MHCNTLITNHYFINFAYYIGGLGIGLPFSLDINGRTLQNSANPNALCSFLSRLAMPELPDHAAKTIADFQQMIEKMERETNSVKSSVNMLCRVYGVDPMYDIAEPGNDGGTKPKSIEFSVRPDEFFSKPLATAVREVLNARKSRDLGPIDPRELFDLLRKGGFAFDQRDETTAFRVMQISISKNTAAFVRLPNEQIGLVEWYGPQKVKARAPAKAAAVTTSETADASTEGNLTTGDQVQANPTQGTPDADLGDAK